ncbi:MAG TPA: hypothetical protein VGE14_13205 [Marmoricola sp.]
MRTTTTLLATVVLSAGLLAGCGDDGGDGGDAKSSGGTDSGSSYCDKLKDAKESFDSFESDTPDFDQFEDAIETFHDLADSAPSEVEDEWKTLDGAFTSMEKSLQDAGLSFEDLGTITAGQLPEGMTAAELQALTPKLQEAFTDLDNEKFEEAGETIEKHAKSECDIVLDDDADDDATN